MTDTLTALDLAKMKLDMAIEKIPNGFSLPNGVAPLLDQAQSEFANALTALTEPFDPAKAEGWVKHESEIQDYWQCGHFFLRKHGNEWGIRQDYGVQTQRYLGPIPTAHFFALLCGALNIK